MFNLDNDFRLIISNTDDIQRDHAIVYAGLEEMEKMELIKKIEFDQTTTNKNMDKKTRKTVSWVLKKPLIMHEQEVKLTPDVIIGISNCLNNFTKAVRNNEFMCNSLNVDTNDIRNLLKIIAVMLENQEKKES